MSSRHRELLEWASLLSLGIEWLENEERLRGLTSVLPTQGRVPQRGSSPPLCRPGTRVGTPSSSPSSRASVALVLHSAFLADRMIETGRLWG